MKKLLTVSNSEPFAARILKATLVLVIGLALGTAFWVASMPVAQAQDMSPAKMIESQLPQGKTAASASKTEFLEAICGAVKKFRSAAPQIVRSAVGSHPNWSKDILRTAFRCLGAGGTDDCRLLGAVLRAAIASDGSNASELTDLAISLAPNCAGGFGQAPGGEGEGNFGNPPGNQNPPPGSIGGGGGQGNVIAVCHNGVTIFLTPEAAEDAIRNGDTLGPCVVTQATNN